MKKETVSSRTASWAAMLALPFALVVLTLRLMTAAAAPAAQDFLDPDFGDNGRTLIPITGTNQIARDVARQPDGKIIIAGYDNWQTNNYDAVMARVNPDGSLDATFGVGGVVTKAFSSGNDVIYAVDLQPDGKIVASGFLSQSGNVMASVMRFNANGSLDASFGVNGVVTTSFQPNSSWFLSVAVLDDGRILAGGSVGNSPNPPGLFLLARYQANGAPDTSFGSNGVVTTTIPGGDANSWDMALQPDGKIVLAGFHSGGGGVDFALARYNADGSLDSSFATGGYRTQDIGGNDYVYGVNVQANGKIVAGGLSNGQGGVLARYNADGSDDDSFGLASSLNYVTTTVPGYNSTTFIETALRADDGIVAATRASGDPPIVAITVFDKDGRPQSFLGPSGVITAANGTNTATSYALLVQPDDKVVLAGHVDRDDTSGYEYDLALWRFILRGRVYLPLIVR